MAGEGEEKKPKPGNAPPDDPDKEFWEAEGVTDDEEKEAVRARARVIRYASWKTKQDEEAAKAKKKGGEKRNRWYKED